ncbi:MAG TPA: serine hydrolase domain-containing protein [Candidatus Limiplasma sp.]|nr:serine hydrolase domain-containing protein [Candidatus Limiplasma sp.]
MPVTERKNKLYAAALPILGRRSHWKRAQSGGGDSATLRAVEALLKKHHVVGGCVQMIRGGQAAECYTAGYGSLAPLVPVRPDTVFRTASIAKAVCALLVFRLQTCGKLYVEEDISSFWHREIRNPNHPDTPIPLGALLSHSAGIVDTPRYFRSFDEAIGADELLGDRASFLAAKPYERFRYSNFGAGLIGSLLEHRFQVSIEELIQRELFAPLGIAATADITRADAARLANSYRILPPERAAAFDAAARREAASPILAPDPQRHFLLMSGNLFLTAGEMAKLCLLVIHGGKRGEETFINESSLHSLLTPVGGGGQHWPGICHGMGMFLLEDKSVSSRSLHGHQGFAYGAVNGFFFDDAGNGFVSFNSGASERRVGRLSCLNRDLIRVLLP